MSFCETEYRTKDLMELTKKGEEVWRQLRVLCETGGYNRIVSLQEELRELGVDTALGMRFSGDLKPADRRMLSRQLNFRNMYFPLRPEGKEAVQMELLYNIRQPRTIGDTVIDTTDALSIDIDMNNTIAVQHSFLHEGIMAPPVRRVWTPQLLAYQPRRIIEEIDALYTTYPAVLPATSLHVVNA